MMSGHHLEYVRYLLQYDGWPAGTTISFLLLQEAIDLLQEEYTTTKYAFYPVPMYRAGNQIKKTWKEGEFVRKLVDEIKVTHLYLLNLDPYQHVVGVGALRRDGVKLGGILFSPPHRLEGWPKGGAKAMIRKLRKQLQLWVALANSDLEVIHILDDAAGVVTLNKAFRAAFAVLPDPLPQKDRVENGNYFLDKYGVPEHHKIVTSFGSVIPRKNLEACLLAFAALEKEDLWLAIVGKGTEEYVNQLRQLINSFPENIVKRIILNNSFVLYEEIPNIFASSDIVLMVYKDFYGSSGVLGHAASSYKPVLAANRGLIDELVNQYHLGITVAENPHAIEAGLRTLLSSEIDRSNVTAYLKGKNEEGFCKAIASFLEKT